MTASRLVALVALGLLAMSNSCKKEDVVPCNASADVTIAQVAGLTASITEPVPNVGQTNQYFINSMAEYEAVFAGDCLPPIDFSRHTLLAGKTLTPTGCRVLTQQVAQTCTGYKYTVQLARGPGRTAANVVYYALLPKIQGPAQVEFDVQMPAQE